jgi:outer membrane receptor for ferrienterochelin and colicins
VKLTVTFPTSDPNFVYEIALEESHEELEEVSVSATRTSRTIADQATRVETIAGEEIEEKISMEPGNISMLLNESPGINVQQTSAVTGASSIQIQGLDGRYTQILKDGFPLFGGFSGGLSLLQVPPLDLQQVEVIKGPSFPSRRSTPAMRSPII